MRKLIVAPFEFHDRMLRLIARETEQARQGQPARIIAKMNSLVDEQIIAALYRASQAGVRIDLIVRGICCLRPGLKGVSENISVRSIVDRFLEHSRIFYFENACQPEVFVGSADWMPRNFFRRIEISFPIEDPALWTRLITEVLGVSLADTAKARFLQPDGSYRRASPGNSDRLRRSQFEFMSLSANGGKPGRKPQVKKTRYPHVRLAPRPSESTQIAPPRRQAKR